MDSVADIEKKIADLKKDHASKIADIDKKIAEIDPAHPSISASSESEEAATVMEPVVITPEPEEIVVPDEPTLEPIVADEKRDENIEPEPIVALVTPEPNELEPEQGNYQIFKEKFLREHKDDGLASIFEKIENIPGFNGHRFSDGQRSLVIEKVVENIRDEVEKMTAAEFARRGKMPHGMIGKIPLVGNLANGILNSVDKIKNQTKITKSILNHVLTGASSLDFIERKAEAQIKLLNEIQLDAIVGPNGGVYMDFAKTLEYGKSTPEAIRLNIVGTKFARMPQSWGIKKLATKEQYTKWQKAKIELDDAIENLVPLYKNRAKEQVFSFGDKKDNLNDEARGALEARATKSLIETVASLSKNPKAAEELRSIATEDALKKLPASAWNFLKSNFTLTRLGSISAGVGIRALAGTVLGGTLLAGLPVTLAVAGIAGGTVGFVFRGGRVAKQKLIAEAKNMRNATLFQTAADGKKVFEKKSATSAVMSKIEHRTKQLALITQELSDLGANGGSAIEIANKQNQLETHLKYIEEKIAKGEMNYGDEAGEYKRTVALLLAKQEADVVMELTKQSLARNKDYFDFIHKDGKPGLSIWTETESSLEGQVEPDNLEKGFMYGGWRHDISDNHRRGMLNAIQNSTHEFSVKSGINAARESAMWKQRFESAKTGALLGSISAYVMDCFYHHTDVGHAVQEETHKIATGIAHGARTVTDTLHITHSPTIDNLISHSKTGTATEPVVTTSTTQNEVVQSSPKGSTAGGVAPSQTTPIAKTEIPHITPGTTPEKIISFDTKNPLAHVSIKKGEGIGDALLKIKSDPSFKALLTSNPDMAKFFQGNIWQEAKALHAFRPGNPNGESLLVGPGSEIGIAQNGDIYLKNTLGNTTEVIGHIDPKTGTFSEAAQSTHLQYKHTGNRSVENPTHPNQPSTKDDLIDNPNLPKNTAENPSIKNSKDDIIDEPILQKTNHPEIKNSKDDLIDAPVIPNNKDDIIDTPSNEQPAPSPLKTATEEFTRADWKRVDVMAERTMTDNLNNGFGRKNWLDIVTHKGSVSPLWKGMSLRSTKSVFEQLAKHPDDFSSPVLAFLKHAQALKISHPEIAPSEKFGDYYEKLVQAEAEDYVLSHPSTDPK